MSKKLTIAQMNSLALPKTEKLNIPFAQNNGDIIHIEFKQKLMPYEVTVFTDKVVNFCFDLDGNYYPEYKELGIFMAILQSFSNMPIPKRKATDGEEMVDIPTLSAWFECTNLLYNIMSRDCPLADTLGYLLKIIDEKIEFKKQSIHCEQRKILEECNARLALEQAEVLEKMDSLITLFGSLSAGLEGDNKAQFISDVHTLAGIDEKQLVNNVLNFTPTSKISSKSPRKAKPPVIKDVT